MTVVFKKPIKKIVWAVDPFEKEISPDGATLQRLFKDFQNTGAQIKPAYVFSPLTEIESLASEKITLMIKNYCLKIGLECESPQILIDQQSSVLGSVMALNNYIKETATDLVLVSSHGRRGLGRFFLGSFAESLLNNVSAPVMFLNQRPMSQNAHLKKVVWATDFSKAAEKAFRIFLEQSKNLVDEVLIYHDLSLPIEMARFMAGYEIGASWDDKVLEDWAKESGQKWLDLAKAQNFKATLVTEMATKTLSRAILNTASKANAGAVVMMSAAGPFASVMFGSAARDVFQASEIPLWVYGAHLVE